MKKSTKITLIVAVILMLVGGIVAAICLVLGGDLDDLQFYIDIPLGQEQQDAVDPKEMLSMLADDDSIDRWEFEREEIHSLDLDLEAGTLYLQQGESWQVLASNGREGLRCEVKNGVLFVKETDSFQTLLDWSGNSTPIISVTIPAATEEAKVLEMIRVTVGAGEVQAEGLSAGKVEINVDAGTFSCTGMTVKERCQIDVDAGSVEIRDGHILGDLKIDMDVGMAAYDGILEGDWQVDCDAGSVNMALTGTVKDHNYQIRYDMGTVMVGDKEYGGMSDEVHLANGASHEAQIQCDVGQVTVRFDR